MAASAGISADEIALYDRQIRLWGVQAQERIRSANVLLINIKAVGTEIAKNLVLNGIGSLTIVDSGVVTDDDLGAQYFLRDTDIGANRAQAAAPRVQELNPRVAVIANPNDPSQFTEDFYRQFDMVIASDLPFLLTAMINAATRMVQRPFYATGIHGFYGFVFADLVEHEYIIERERSNIPTVPKPETLTRSVVAVTTKKENGKNIELVTKKEIYSPLLLANSSPLPSEYLKSRRRLKGVSPLLPALRALWEFERRTGRFPGHAREDLVLFTTLANEKVQELQLPSDTLRADFLRSFLHNVGSELVPTAAFVGGRLSEDVTNVLGKREQPVQNFLLFDGDSFQAPIYPLHPIFEDAPLPQDGIGFAPVAPVQALPTEMSNGTLPVANGDLQTTPSVVQETQPQQQESVAPVTGDGAQDTEQTTAPVSDITNAVSDTPPGPEATQAQPPETKETQPAEENKEAVPTIETEQVQPDTETKEI